MGIGRFQKLIARSRRGRTNIFATVQKFQLTQVKSRSSSQVTSQVLHFDELQTVDTAVLLVWLCDKRIPCSIKNGRADILFKVTQPAAKN